MRLRQVVLVAATLEPTVGRLRRLFGLGEGFRDPGVGRFGLVNTVFAIGDTFLEVVAPIEDDTAAGRYLERRSGDGGYMVIVQVDDMESARARLSDLGIRIVWSVDHDDIKGTHLHPRDVGGAILSLDEAIPPESWRWAGPRWREEADTSVVREITAVELQADDLAKMAARWGAALDVAPSARGDCALLELDRGAIRFVDLRDDRGEGVCGFDVAVADGEQLRRNAEELGLSVSDGGVIDAFGVRIGLVE